MPERRICSESVHRALEKNPFEKLSVIVFSILEDAILSSELPPGAKLNVTRLSAELDVSSSPVREAIDQLCESGLVREEKKVDGKYSNYYVFDISNDSIEDLFVARKTIEGMAAYICAERNWRIDLGELEHLAKEFQSQLKAYGESSNMQPDIYYSSRIDMDFHTLLVNATANKFLISMYDTIYKSVKYLSIRTNQFTSTRKNMENLLLLGSQHMAIYRAIRDGEPDAARTAMEKHIDFCSRACLLHRYLQS